MLVLRSPGAPVGPAGVRRLLAALAGVVVVGLVWAVQAFESPHWWSTADLAEGVSLVLLVAMAGALHAGSAHMQRVTIVAALLGAALASGFRLPCPSSEAIHQWYAWGSGYTGLAAVGCTCVAYCVRGAFVGRGVLLGAVGHAGVASRVACLSTAVLWPYGAAVALGSRGCAPLLAWTGQLLVWARPLHSRVGTASVWVVALGCGAGL